MSSFPTTAYIVDNAGDPTVFEAIEIFLFQPREPFGLQELVDDKVLITPGSAYF